MALIERTLSLPQWWVEAQLTELFTPVTDVVPVVGAGVGAGVGLPDAGALAEWLAEKLPLVEQPENPRDLFRVVDLVDPDQASRADLARLVAERITSVSAQPPRFLEELVRLPSRLILTFNYDDLIGTTAEKQGIDVCRLSALEPDEAREAHRRVMVSRRGGRRAS